MSALSSYLAKNYLTASGASDHSDRPKKRRKKDKAAPVGPSLIIADDDDDLLLSGQKVGGKGDEDDGIPAMYEGQQRSAEFRKKKNSGWKAVSRPGDGAVGADEADRILASAATDQEQHRLDVEGDDAPAIVSENDDAAPRMASGGKVGLQTAEDTKRLLEKEDRQQRREEKEAARKAKRDHAPEEETIYRDATGRRIDVSLRRAEIRKEQEAVEAAKKKEREDAMGEVQRRQKEERKQDMDDAKFMTLGRGVEDEEMNERLKEVVRFDDPMREYMAQKRAEEGGGGGGEDIEVREGAVVGGAVKNKAKVYQGHAPPNRYGILPGWRWDGVDRGNGFEKEWFQARSRSKRNEELSYLWAQDE